MADFLKINGIDWSIANGIKVKSIDGLTPLAPLRLERSRGKLQQSIENRRITINLIAEGNATVTSLHSRIDTFAGQVGAQGRTRREISIEYLDGASVIRLLNVIVEDFDVEYIEPQALQIIALIQMRCLVVSSSNPAGRTVVNTSINGSSIGIQHAYIGDATNYQSGSRFVLKMTPSVSGNLGVYSLATESDYYSPHTASTFGNVGVVDGQYGYPAMSTAASGAYLRYTMPFALPIYGSNYACAVVRFKRNYDMSHATAKYLIDEGSQFRVSIDATTQTIRFVCNGTALTLSGANVSNLYFNTVIACVAGSNAYLYLYTPGVGTTSTSATGISTFSTTNLYLYVGNSSAGTNPSQSYISEVGIYKHDLSVDAMTTLLTAVHPIRDLRKYDLNRNLTFLLDFSNGFTASANRPSGLAILNQITSSETLVLDFDRLLAHKTNKTSGTRTDISNEMIFSANFERQIIISKGNKFMYNVPTSGTVALSYSYDSGRYQ